MYEVAQADDGWVWWEGQWWCNEVAASEAYGTQLETQGEQHTGANDEVLQMSSLLLYELFPAGGDPSHMVPDLGVLRLDDVETDEPNNLGSKACCCDVEKHFCWYPLDLEQVVLQNVGASQGLVVEPVELQNVGASQGLVVEPVELQNVGASQGLVVEPVELQNVGASQGLVVEPVELQNVGASQGLVVEQVVLQNVGASKSLVVKQVMLQNVGLVAETVALQNVLVEHCVLQSVVCSESLLAHPSLLQNVLVVHSLRARWVVSDSELAARNLVADPLFLRPVRAEEAVQAVLSVTTHDVDTSQIPMLDCLQVCPLLTEIGVEDHSWWLLDSGACVTVLSKTFAETYHAKILGPAPPGFRAANGSSVGMTHVAEVHVDVQLGGHQKRKWFTARLKVLVGNTKHNILGTTALCACGWTFIQGKGQFSLKHDGTGLQAVDTCFFAGCPWVQLRPRTDPSSTPLRMTDVENEDNLPESMDVSAVKKVRSSAETELTAHRLRGHTPFEPTCLHCQKARGVHQHRRRTASGLQTEIQADYFFISAEGQVSTERAPGSIKCLALKECFSSCVGCVVIDGVDLVAARRCLVHWLQEFGLASSKVAVTLVTDSEAAVSSFVTNVSNQYHFLVKRAGPQVHEAAGHAERCVRTLKESMQVLRSDMNQAGVDLRIRSDLLQDLFSYLCMAHNSFSKAHGAEKSPQEVAVGRVLPESAFTLYLSVVLAEVPDSIKEKYSNVPRYVEACFLHPQWQSQGLLCIGKLRHDNCVVLERFVAKSIKVVLPLKWDPSFCPERLVEMKTISAEGCSTDAPVATPMPEQVRPSLSAPATGPPSEWIRQHGFTSGCHACNGLKQNGSRSGRIHSRACITNYENWLKAQGAQLAGAPAALQHPRSQSIAEGEPVNVGVERGEGTSSASTGMPAANSEEVPVLRRVRFKNSQSTGVNQELLDKGRVPEQAVLEKKSSQAIPFETPVQSETTVQSDTDVEMALPPAVREAEFRQKRKSEVDTQSLEHEIADTARDAMVDVVLQLGLLTSSDSLPLCEITQLTGPEFYDPSLESIKFEGRVTMDDCTKMSLGQETVLVWKPTGAVDDTTMDSLDIELTYKGMLEEIQHLEECRGGRVMSELRARELLKSVPNSRLIPTRWVTAFKSASRVRARIVAKDLNKGTSARALGYSSPTPSQEALSLLLATVASRDWRLMGLDVSHAFMHSPTPEGECVVLKLPLSVSLTDGMPAYLHAHKALNGMRDASLRWLSLLTSTVNTTGLWTCELDPCLYTGIVIDPVSGQHLGKAMLLVYVDDVLLGCETLEAELLVKAAIESRVPVKVTGVILPSDQGGGRVNFIGRCIQRWPGRSQLELSVDPAYLDSCFQAYNVTSSTASAPDLGAHLERATQPGAASLPLTEEAYTRFRKVLGKLLWWTQTRQDFKFYLSLLATQQAKPMQCTESALRALLRFLRSDTNTVLKIPADTPLLELGPGSQSVVQAFSDASHAPYRCTGRKGVTGGVILHDNGLIKCISKQQQCVALSSCESEVYGIQAVAQESVAFARLVFRVAFSFGEVEEQEPIVVLLESDSQAGLDLLKGQDLPRKSRHIEIRLELLKQKVRDKEMVLKFRPGSLNVGDLMTKCLGTALFKKHRQAIGFDKPEGPVDLLFELGQRVHAQTTVAKHVCCVLVRESRHNNVVLCARGASLMRHLELASLTWCSNWVLSLTLGAFIVVFLACICT